MTFAECINSLKNIRSTLEFYSCANDKRVDHDIQRLSPLCEMSGNIFNVTSMTQCYANRLLTVANNKIIFCFITLLSIFDRFYQLKVSDKLAFDSNSNM